MSTKHNKEVSKIFKDLKNFKPNKIDFNSPEIKKAVADCQRQQEECLRRKEIDYEQLDKRITI